jgi:hypothetical protein
MNSNELYTGEHYAWHPNRTKGSIPIGAAKVEVTRIRRVKQIYEKNRRTEVTIKVLREGTGSSLRYYPVGTERTVSARELIDFWAFYKDEEDALLREQERKTYDIRKKKAYRQVLAGLLNTRLAEKGLNATDVTLNYGNSVTIDLDALKNWLHITETEIEDAVLVIVGPLVEATSGYTTD